MLICQLAAAQSNLVRLFTLLAVFNYEMRGRLTHEGADQSCPQQCGCPNKIEVKPRLAQNADPNFLEDNDGNDCRHQQVPDGMNQGGHQRSRWGH